MCVNGCGFSRRQARARLPEGLRFPEPVFVPRDPFLEACKWRSEYRLGDDFPLPESVDSWLEHVLKWLSEKQESEWGWQHQHALLRALDGGTGSRRGWDRDSMTQRLRNLAREWGFR